MCTVYLPCGWVHKVNKYKPLWTHYIPYKFNKCILIHKHRIVMVSYVTSETILWWNIALWDWMLRHQKNWRIWNSPNLIDSLFILSSCFTKNTQMFNFSNCIFWPTPLPFLSNTPSLTLLNRCSLSLSPSLSICPHSIFTCDDFI